MFYNEFEATINQYESSIQMMVSDFLSCLEITENKFSFLYGQMDNTRCQGTPNLHNGAQKAPKRKAKNK